MGEGYRRRDTAGALAVMLRRAPMPLPTVQLRQRAGIAGKLALYRLNALAAEGKVGRIAGKPQRWYWRDDRDHVA